MNNLSLAIYLSDIVGKVFQTMTFLSITGGILYAIFVLFLVMEPDRDLARETLKSGYHKIALITLLFVVMAALVIPSKQAVLLIASSEAGQAVAQSDEGKKVIQDLLEVIHSQLNALKKE